MKRHRRRIFIVLILCILLTVWILIGDKSWTVSLENFFKPALKYIYKERTWTIPVIVTVIIGLIGALKYIIMSRKRKPSEIISPKPKIRATFEIESIKQLGKVLKPYIENLVVGKFIEITAGKTWDDVKNEVDFSKLDPLDLSTPHKVFIIKGKAGIGKSTYMLWSLDESLRNKSWGFNKIIFLNPDAYEQWAEELSEYDPRKTFLVIDALRRGGDTDEIFKKRCSHLFRLVSGEERMEERIIGPFKVLTTIRDNEYEYLTKQKEFEWISDSTFLYELTSEKLNFEMILKKYLQSYRVPYEVPANRETAVIKQLISKSGGLPFYIRHLVADLKATNRSFSERILEEYPPGMANLIWQTIKRGYYIENDPAIPFLLLLLLDTDKGFSSYYFSFVTEELAQKKEDAFNKVESLKKVCLQSSLGVTDPKGAESFSLDSHWKISLRIGLEHPEDIREEYKDVVNFYKRINDERFHRLADEIAIDLKNHLHKGFKDKADIFLCVDLAKMGEENLETATKVYSDFYSSSKLPQDYIKYMQEELYELWISNAWKYRAVYDDDKVITCYENAFNKLGVRTHRKQFHAYAYFLQTRVLPKYEHETLEFQECAIKIEGLYNEVIKLKPNDPISYQALALFYKNLGEYQKAEDNFKKSLQIDFSHIPTLQAYAILLKDMGNIEWGKDRKKALECYKEAQEKFETGRNLLKTKAEKGELSREEKQNEKELLNAYAVFLIDQAGWQAVIDEKRKYDELADALFQEVLEKYPDHKESINKYADFLMKYGWILPKYKGGKNLEKAETLLNSYIAESKKGDEPPDPITLHTLAILLYKFKPLFEKQPPDFEGASEILKESAKSPNPKHNSIAHHELGRLYMRWAKFLEANKDEYNAKMDLAEEAIQKALELPENPINLMHLSKVYLTYAFYSTYRGQIEQARVYRNKAFGLAKQAQMIPIYYYLLFNSMGDELIEEEPGEAIEFYTKAKEVGEELDLNNSYPYFKLGECYKIIGDIEKSLDNYLRSARDENTSEGYGTRRNSIKQLMQDNDIRKSTQPALYDKCIIARRECSEKAHQLDQNSWKNCGDYGEDLLELGEYERAIPVLEKGVSLILQSEELNEVDKRKKLSWFYEKNGFCYKDLGDSAKAKEYLYKSAQIEDSAISYFRLVGWMYELGKYEEAITAFQSFVEKFPSCGAKEKENIFRGLTDILEDLAISYENLSQEDESILAWKHYADVSFYYSEPQEGARVCGIVGNKLLRVYKLLEARECFLKSIRLNPNSAQNLSQLGYINKSLQRWEECKICSERAFSIRHDPRDKRQYEYCQKEYEKNPKVYDTSKIDDLIDLAIIEELKDENEKASKYYSDALTMMRESQDKTDISRYMFIADAFWVLGYANNALELYKEIKDMLKGYQKIIAEAIIWFISSKIGKIERENLPGKTVA